MVNSRLWQIPPRLAVAGMVGDHLLALLSGEQLAGAAGMALLSAPLAAGPLRFSPLPFGLNSLPSLDGGFEEFLELRPFCSSN